MANWENHKFLQDWEDSLASKNFAFAFVNSNIALFSVAFYEQNFNSLCYNLAIILAVKQIAMSLIDLIIPMISVKLKKWRLRKKFEEGFPGMAEGEE